MCLCVQRVCDFTGFPSVLTCLTCSRHSMHIVWHLPSGGELWMGGLEASGRVTTLLDNGISALVPCSPNVRVVKDSRVKDYGCVGHVWLAVRLRQGLFLLASAHGAGLEGPAYRSQDPSDLQAWHYTQCHFGRFGAHGWGGLFSRRCPLLPQVLAESGRFENLSLQVGKRRMAWIRWTC